MHRAGRYLAHRRSSSSPRLLDAAFQRAATTTTARVQKREGDISDAFVSLSGRDFEPLPDRYSRLKGRLIEGNEEAVRASWERLLRRLREELPAIAEAGPAVVPQIDFADLRSPSEDFVTEHRKRGVAVIRGVIPEEEVLQYKEDIRNYIKQNPHTKGLAIRRRLPIRDRSANATPAFPPDNPQVFELYWSRSQIRARTHPNLLKAHRFLMGFWHSKDPDTPISSSHPTSYADRLRMRQPGDAKFALGPHVDGGSVERWEEEGYGRGHVYDAIWQGRWEDFDPWESSCRLPVASDRYQGVGACSMFRMFQGWLAMSETGPREGTLLVNPLLSVATAYYLLRPFFSPSKPLPEDSDDGASSVEYLSSDNWTLDPEPTSALQGANPGHGQELNALSHPHLKLASSMVHVPRVRPGDYVSWHCDGKSRTEKTSVGFLALMPAAIHAVDRVHAGSNDSSVMYMPACPLTEPNALYLRRQRDAFLKGVFSGKSSTPWKAESYRSSVFCRYAWSGLPRWKGGVGPRRSSVGERCGVHSGRRWDACYGVDGVGEYRAGSDDWSEGGYG